MKFRQKSTSIFSSNHNLEFDLGIWLSAMIVWTTTGCFCAGQTGEAALVEEKFHKESFRVLRARCEIVETILYHITLQISIQIFN